jgi:CheY-like chemotaxis protein
VTDQPVLKAMVVEYNAVVRQGLQERLHQLGFAVAATDDPFRALGWLARHRPHVILVDYALPAMKGPDFASRATAAFGGAHIPIIATGTDQVVEAPPGAVAFLHKPFDPADLDDALQVALAASPDLARPEPADPEVGEPPSEPSRREAAAATTGSIEAVQGAVLTWFAPSGRSSLPIESVTEAGLRVLCVHELELGTRLNAQIDFVEIRRSGERPRQVKLLLRVDSVSQAADGWHCGLRVEMARPPHVWKRFCLQGIY